jgi:hypothetical protein
LEKSHQSKLIPSIKINQRNKRVNHFKFVIDTLLLGGASKIIAKRFKDILMDLMRASNDNINRKKIHIFVWNTTSRVASSITKIFQFPLQENWTSFKYLGIPICLQRLPSYAWIPIIDKI